MRKSMIILRIAAILIFWAGLSRGVYLENVPEILVQPDGVRIACFISGDEFYHRVHDSQGYTIIKDPATGFYVYAQGQGDDLAPS